MLTIVKYNRQIPTNFFVRLLAYARLGLMITARRVCALLLTLHLFIIINMVFLALSLLIFFSEALDADPPPHHLRLSRSGYDHKTRYCF